MLNQTIKGFFIFSTLIFIILAIADYSGGRDYYTPLMATAFMIHFIGYVVDYIFNWHFDRRKQDLGFDQRAYDQVMRNQSI